MGKNKQNYNSCLWIFRNEETSLIVMEIAWFRVLVAFTEMEM